MAYRILAGALIVEVDSASEVASLFGVMGLAFAPTSSTRMLTTTAGVEPTEEIVIPAPAPRRKAVKPRKAKRAHGGGRPSTVAASPKAPAPVSRGPRPTTDLDSKILYALAPGPLSPRQLWSKVGVHFVACRRAVQGLIARGQVRAEGTTMSRRFMLATFRPSKSAGPAKEAP